MSALAWVHVNEDGKVQGTDCAKNIYVLTKRTDSTTESCLNALTVMTVQADVIVLSL